MYAIYFDNDLIAVTNNLDLWILDHNEERKNHPDNSCTTCCYKESLKDFKIVEVLEYVIYDNELNKLFHKIPKGGN